MRDKLHDVIHFETGEVLLEDSWPVDVAIFLKRNPTLTVSHVKQHDQTQRSAGLLVDDVYVDGVLDYSAYV
jgi:hypothetical protein